MYIWFGGKTQSIFHSMTENETTVDDEQTKNDKGKMNKNNNNNNSNSNDRKQ